MLDQRKDRFLKSWGSVQPGRPAKTLAEVQAAYQKKLADDVASARKAKQVQATAKGRVR